MIHTEKDLRGKTFGTVKLWEECRFTDQALLLASLVTGSVDLCFYNLERTQWGPAPCAGAEVLRQKGEPNQNPPLFFFYLKIRCFPQPLHKHSSNLFFDQDIDPLEHPFTGKLIWNVGLNLKCICKNNSYKHIIL